MIPAFDNPEHKLRNDFPSLYHGTAALRPLPGSPVRLTPKPAMTISGEISAYLFATHLPSHAALYATRLKEYTVLDTIVRTSVSPIPLHIIHRQQEYQEALAKHHPMVVRLDSAAFLPVLQRHGFVSEWFTLDEQQAQAADITRLNGIDDAMDTGVQIYFLDPAKDRNSIRHEFRQSRDRTTLLQEMVDDGTLAWHNARTGHNPITLPSHSPVNSSCH